MTPASGWLVQETDGLPHVLPLGDLREHVTNRPCWCGACEDDGVIVHNSMDRREEYERGRKAS